MDIFGSTEGGKAFELVPEGNHVGVIRFAVDCGHQRDSYQGVETIKHQIFIGWELDCQDSEGNPHWKGDFFTATDFIHGPTLANGKPNPRAGEADWFFGSTSNFNKILRGWTDQDADTVKWKSFTAKLMREQHPCIVNIEHNESKDGLKTFSNIDSIKKCKKGETYKRIGPIVSWTFGFEGFDDLPGNLKKRINASIEKVEGSYTVPPKEPKHEEAPPVKPKKAQKHDVQDPIPF